MGLGGPVWHASIARHRNGRPEPLVGLVDEHLRRAERALSRVGDPALGEWVEVGDVAVHLRRRLSGDEADHYQLAVRDIRGTAEAERRLAYIRTLIPGYQE